MQSDYYYMLIVAITEPQTVQPNRPDDVHHSSGEDDTHSKLDQPAVEDSAPLTSSEVTTAAASQTTPPEDPQEVRGHVDSVTDQFGEEKELCLLPEKAQEDPFDVGSHGNGGGGGDLDDLGDPADPGEEVPNKEEEQKPETLPHRQEEDTTKGRV